MLITVSGLSRTEVRWFKVFFTHEGQVNLGTFSCNLSHNKCCIAIAIVCPPYCHLSCVRQIFVVQKVDVINFRLFAS